MRFTWGHGILIVLIMIVVGFSYVFIQSLDQNHELVTENYYAKELDFQEQIDKTENALRAEKELTWELTETGLEITLSPAADGEATGTLLLQRPSDASLDVEEPLALDESSKHTIAADRLKRGKYVLQIDWKEGDQPYFLEKNLFIP